MFSAGDWYYDKDVKATFVNDETNTVEKKEHFN